jgi:hypothetical protein
MSTVTRSKVSAKSAEKARRKAYVVLYQHTGRDYADMYRRKRNGYIHEIDFHTVRMYLEFATRSATCIVDNLPYDRDGRRRWLGMLSKEKARVRYGLAEIAKDRLAGHGLWRPIGGDVPFSKGGSNV